MNDHTTFGSRLKSFRNNMKLSGEDLGAIFGVLKTQVSGIERDKTKPTVEGCIKLSAAFPDLDLNWLLTGRGEMFIVEEEDREYCWPLLQAEKEKLRAEKEKLQAVREMLQAARNKTEALEELLRRHGAIKPRI